MNRRILGAALVFALALGALAVSDEAWARVGGGQSYGGSHGGSSGGGGGGDLDIGIVILLINLVVDFPLIGIPLVIVVGVVFVWNRRSRSEVRARTRRDPAAIAAPARVAPGADDLRARDPDFSMVTFLDFAVMVHRRTMEAVTDRRQDDALAPFVDPTTLERLRERLGGAVITEVVCGAVRVMKAEKTPNGDRLFARLETTRVETKDGRAVRSTVEDWIAFRRPEGVASLPPEKMSSLGCPSCGAPIEVTALGACVQCGSAIAKGQLQWQLVYFEERGRKAVTGPMLALGPGGDEPGVRMAPLVSSRLPAELKALEPFDGAAFQARAKTTFLELQAAWTLGRWQRARPFTTDRLFQTLRFWMDQYAEAGLKNVLEDIELLEARPVEASVDRWFQAITVRVVGRMKDSTVDGDGKVVSGNAKVARRFAEYWTFVRSIDRAPPKGEGANCPSCGAPLDRVDETGVCGYCDAKITSGRFDWVLSRIEQPQAVR